MMVWVTIVLMVGSFWAGRVVSRRVSRKGSSVRRISEEVWLTPNGVVDLGKKPELSPADEIHNRMNDFLIAQRDREYEHYLEQCRLKGEIPILAKRKLFLIYKAG